MPAEKSEQAAADQASLKGKIRETGPFRSWEFTREQLLAGAEKFFKYVGYELLPLPSMGFVRPDLYARRSQGNKTYEVVVAVRTSLEEAVEGCAQLSAIRAVRGEEVDYVLLLPPVNEYLLIEFLTAEKGQWFFAMKDQKIMMWLTNPEQETVWCIVGGPRDRLFESYFVLISQPIDPYISMRLSRELLEEEDY